MPFFTAPDGVRLHYTIEGSGPSLVLHLGAGGDSELWQAAGYLRWLARGNTCILFDHRGHGKSEHPATVESNMLDRYVDDVTALVGHLRLRNAAFFGWSNGLSVGLRVAERHPDLFDALILFGSIAPRTTPEQLAVATQQRLAAMREKGWRYLLDEMVAAEKLPVPEWFLDRVLATDTGPWFAYTEARPLWNWSPWDALPRIVAPTLLLAGELEDPHDVMAEVKARMPDATRVRIPEREHIMAFLHSDLVAPLVADFLAAHRRSPVA